jgi:hypothetical protein
MLYVFLIVAAVVAVVAVRHFFPRYVVTMVEPETLGAKSVAHEVARGNSAEHRMNVTVVAKDEKEAAKVAKKVARGIEKANRKAGTP